MSIMTMFANINRKASVRNKPAAATAIFADRGPDAASTVVVRRLNKLLEGEICAAENYTNLIGCAPADVEEHKVEVLEELKAEHVENCDLLKDRIIHLGGKPSDTAGSWGVWTHAVHGNINLFSGDMGGIWALYEGEENALIDFATAIDDVDLETAHLIVDRLVPYQRKHLAVLDQILHDEVRTTGSPLQR